MLMIAELLEVRRVVGVGVWDGVAGEDVGVAEVDWDCCCSDVVLESKLDADDVAGAADVEVGIEVDAAADVEATNDVVVVIVTAGAEVVARLAALAVEEC